MLSPIVKHGSPIYLKPVTTDDLDIFQQIYGSEEVMRYIGQIMTPEQANIQLNKTIQVMQAKYPDYLTFVIIDKESDSKVGLTGLSWFDGHDRATVAVGVMILAHWRRRKIAHQAKTLIINAAFETLGIDTVYAYCQISNQAANAANKKLKFNKGKLLKQGQNKTTLQEWFIEKSKWNESIFI